MRTSSEMTQERVWELEAMVHELQTELARVEALYVIPEKKRNRLYLDIPLSIALDSEKVESWGMISRTAKHINAESIHRIAYPEESVCFRGGNYRLVAFLDGVWVRVHKSNGRSAKK